ncbi:uncharacterized protein LOC62_04G006066 [Vanrija pseudolonga]|uniref:Uncharacterized protein n=1 Tax=Vanrija pseudolonga TaxID=143232 RepID=A0AAF0YF08_9TREE|nr:hypothetical protein LOC62_04G006066 [Vanrija pseudolonga]
MPHAAPSPTFPRAEWPADSTPLSAAARAASRRVGTDIDVTEATFALALYDKVSEYTAYLRAMHVGRDAPRSLEAWRLETDALVAAVYALADHALPFAPELPDVLPFVRAALDAGYVRGVDADEAMPRSAQEQFRAFSDEYGLEFVERKAATDGGSMSADEGEAALARRRRRPKMLFRRRITLTPAPMGKVKIKSAALSHQFVRLAVSTP